MTKRWLWPGVLLATATAVALVAATLVYLRAPVPPGAASGPWPTVSLFGRAGSLGTLGSLSDGPAPATLASGQSFASHAVSGWSFPAGVRAGGAVVAKDGTVMLPTATQSYDPAATTARDLAIATYQPRTDRFALVPITHADTLRASSIGDLLVLGDAVVFTTTANDPAAPALGVLSTSEGGWRVAKQWTLAELGLVPGGLARITRLPDSGDLIATRLNGDIVAIRMAGPDRDGRYTARVMATYTHHSPGFPLSSGYLTADPTRRRPDERFALSLIPHDPKNRNQPPVLQEFRYDAGAGSISAVSAPIIPGDLSEDHIPQGFSVIVYDRRGWLWAARQLGFRGRRRWP